MFKKTNVFMVVSLFFSAFLSAAAFEPHEEDMLQTFDGNESASSCVESFSNNIEGLQKELVKIRDVIANIQNTSYPNREFRQLFNAVKNTSERVTIIAYGSLMSPGNGRSGTDEISLESYQTMRDVVVFDYQRRYNWDIRVGKNFPQSYISYEAEEASLNATSSKGSYFNAVAIDITVDELDKLRQREIGYDMVPVIYADFERVRDNNNISFNKAVLFSASDEERPSNLDNSMVIYTNNDITPRRYYHDLVNNICKYKKTAEFHEIFKATTFLADGETLARTWRKNATRPNDPNHEINRYEETRKAFWKEKFCSSPS